MGSRAETKESEQEGYEQQQPNTEMHEYRQGGKGGHCIVGGTEEVESAPDKQGQAEQQGASQQARPLADGSEKEGGHRLRVQTLSGTTNGARYARVSMAFASALS